VRDRVTIVEVGPRDGLQNEAAAVPAADKVRLIERLADAGLPVVEATSFVSPRAVPQLADADEVLPAVRRRPGVRYPVLVPNVRGLDRALAAGADAIAVFTAASDEFTRANIGVTIAESLLAFAPVLQRAHAEGMWTRGYISTAFGCPYSGEVRPEVVAGVAAALRGLGCGQISIGDTIGVGRPEQVPAVVSAVAGSVPVEEIALHLHDTGGLALENVAAGLEAVAFQTRDLLTAMVRDMAVSGIPMPSALRVDGGMTPNAWLMQRLADILGQSVEVAATPETTALGAAYHAGQAVGFYGDAEELGKAWAPERVFAPKMSETEREARYGGWLDAVARVRSQGV